MFKLERGRMFFYSEFNPRLVSAGATVVIDIAQVGAKEYSCRDYIYNKFTGREIGWATCRIVVSSSTMLEVISDALPNSGYSGTVYFLDLVAADDPSWFSAQLSASGVVDKNPVQTSSSSPNPVDEVTQGSCVAVSGDGMIATAAHVLTPGHDIVVRMSDGRAAGAEIVSVSHATDVAILRIPEKTPIFMEPVSTRSLSLGDRVFTIGYPAADVLGTQPKYSEGSISAFNGPAGDATYLQISVPIQPGNSGGPLVTDRGELVGLVVATASLKAFYEATGTLPQNVNWAIRGDYVVALLGSKGSPARALSAPEARKRALQAACMVVVVPHQPN